MASLGTLAVNIVARTEKFTAGVTKSLSAIQRFNSGIASATKKALAFGAATTAIGVGVGVAFVKGQLDAVDALAKTSDRLGIATDRLVGLQLAAEEAGVANKTLETSLIRLSKSVSEASQGRGTGLLALNELKLNARDLSRLGLTDQLLLIADRMAGLETQSDRVRIAMELFGKGGAAMLNLLGSGREVIAEAEVAAAKLGLTIDRDMASAVERANDAFGRVLLTAQGLARQFAVRVAPLIEMASKRFVAFVTEDGRIAKFADAVARAFVKAGGTIIRVFGEIKASFKEAQAALTELAADIVSVIPGSGDQGSLMRMRARLIRKDAAADRSSSQGFAAAFESSALATLNRWMTSIERATKVAENNLRVSSQAIALPATVNVLLQSVGKFIGGGSLLQRGLKAGVPAALNAVTGLFGGADNRGPLAFAETGTAESFRQRAAIRRQSEADKGIKQVAKNTGTAAEMLKNIWGAIQAGAPLLPANLRG